MQQSNRTLHRKTIRIAMVIIIVITIIVRTIEIIVRMIILMMLIVPSLPNCLKVGRKPKWRLPKMSVPFKGNKGVL